MKKVVINTCYGGFKLSPKAIKRYYEITHPELTLYFYKEKYADDYESLTFIKTEDLNIRDNFTILSKDYGDTFFSKGFGGEVPFTDDDYINPYLKSKRSDPALVRVVEELGKEANGSYAQLSIVEVQGKYRICEYDGSEWVETPESIEWEE